MTNDIIEIIRSLNGGTVLPSQKDETSEVNLYSEVARLFVSKSDSKYYYLADLLVERGDSKKNNLGLIEKVTVKNDEAYLTIAPPTPNSSYLLLLWKVENIDASLYPLIIKLEENEFFFKKYVFYYTQEELETYTKWHSEINKLGEGNIRAMLEEVSKANTNLDAPEIRFFIRLLIKVPFFNLIFPKAVLKEFDKIVQTKILATRGEAGQNIKKLDQIINQAIQSGNMNADAISDVIYNKLMEG